MPEKSECCCFGELVVNVAKLRSLLMWLLLHEDAVCRGKHVIIITKCVVSVVRTVRGR